MWWYLLLYITTVAKMLKIKYSCYVITQKVELFICLFMNPSHYLPYHGKLRHRIRENFVGESYPRRKIFVKEGFSMTKGITRRTIFAKDRQFVQKQCFTVRILFFALKRKWYLSKKIKPVFCIDSLNIISRPKFQQYI